MDKSRITTTTRSTITMGRRNGSIDERRKKRFFSALCSPAPRAAMLAVARGTAPNSLPDWSMWSRDQDAVVGVIGSPRLHTDATYASSLRCQPLTHSPIIFSSTSSCSYTNWESTLAYTRGWIGVWNTDTDFEKSERRLCGCAQGCEPTQRNVEVISWRTEAGFSGSNRGQERVSNWIDRNFEDASCSDFIVSNRRRDSFVLWIDEV